MNAVDEMILEAKEKATIELWGKAQRAYGNSEISMYDLGKIQNELRNTDADFFGANLF